MGRDLNASGQVTGFAETSDGAFHAFLWDGTRMLDLCTSPTFLPSFRLRHQRLGAGDGGAIVPDAGSHAFLWDGTRMLDLGTLGGAH